MEAAAVNVMITRDVKPDARAAFEQAVRDWIPQALTFPGHLGVFMLKPGAASNEFGALVRFRSHDAWSEFQSWPPYQRFLADIRPLLAAEPRAEPIHGLEAWFTPSEHRTPPRWKMVLLTWLGVNVMVYVAKLLVTAIGGGWPTAIGFLVTNTIVVLALTWAVMPLLTRVCRQWLVQAQ